MSTKPKPQLEVKQVKYVFSEEERDGLNEKMLCTLEERNALEADLQQVKSSYKAKLDLASSNLVILTQQLRNGWEMPPMECSVVYRPKDRKKDYYREDNGELALTQDMTPYDFQMDLFGGEK